MKRKECQQMEQEHDAWQRSIAFRKQENALLKYRLSDMVDSSEGDRSLQTAEYFHNEFLLQDERIRRIAGDLSAFWDQFGSLLPEMQLPENLILMHEQLRADILKFEQEFSAMSNSFNRRMAGNSSSISHPE